MNNAQNSYSGNAPAASEKAPLPTRWFFSRIFCFLLALGIWIYVVNITTQDFEKTFSLINIDVDGWQELQDATNMSIVNLEESKVSVTVKGLRSDISKLTENDFYAYIDVSKLSESGKHRLEVAIDLPDTVSLVSKYPETVTISIDENIECEFDIDIEVTEYSMDNIYEMGTPTADISKVLVKGPSNVLGRVKSAKAFINLGTVMTSSVIRTEILLVDKTGNAIDTTYLTMDATSVTVTVPVTMEKNIKLVCGYIPGVDQSKYSSVTVNPATIKVKGDPKVLNDLDAISVYALDGSENLVLSMDFPSLLLPTGVEILDAPSKIRIVAELKSQTQNTEEITVNTEPVTEPVTSEETTETPLY